MKTKFNPFNNVEIFYESLVNSLENASDHISLLYYTFDHGVWSKRISDVLSKKVKNGVKVDLMIDNLGLILDNTKNAFQSRLFINDLISSGIEVNLFKPKNVSFDKTKRLHIKMCAIDDDVALIGGSNIGDHYVNWRDSNILIKGNFGNTFHDLYDYVYSFSNNSSFDELQMKKMEKSYSSGLKIGDFEILLTVPDEHHDIYESLLSIISNSERELYIRTWYFLPGREIMDSIMAQIKDGIRVKILISNKTRVRPIDWIGKFYVRKLANAGAEIYRYKKSYMHSKVYWNDNSEILFGSANLNSLEFNKNFELSLKLKNTPLNKELSDFFSEDQKDSILVK